MISYRWRLFVGVFSDKQRVVILQQSRIGRNHLSRDSFTPNNVHCKQTVEIMSDSKYLRHS